MSIIKEIGEHFLFSSLSRFRKILHSQKSHKRVVINQKNGEERIVYVPCQPVKLAQRYILENYLSQIDYSDCAFAYTKGKSIVDVVSVHTGNKYFLHIDVKHFFDNMRWEVFKTIINKHFPETKIAQLINEEEKEIKTILTFRNIFRQGSVTSPYVSNIYMKEFDDIMADYVSKNLSNGKYTRYSDDIFISSIDFINHSHIDYIKNVLHKYGLRINYKKVWIRRLKDSVPITGLSLLTNGNIVSKTSFKKRTKKMIYSAINKKEKANYNVLFGHLYFLMMVDPSYFNILQNKYKNGDVLMMDLIKNKEKETSK